MKKILLSIIFLASLQVSAQTIPADETKLLPDRTGFGVADGKLVSHEIGAGGGTISSADGRVELIFPPGALTTNTTISIQPITNLFDSVAGKAYQFEPSGIQFKKPVDIVFHYTDAENEICPADLMSFSMQGHNGEWTSVEYDQWDSTARILKGKIQHFSAFTNVNKISLKADDLLMVNDSCAVELRRKGVIKTGDFAGRPDYAVLNVNNKREWFVNGVAGGNVYEGYLADGANFTLKESLFLTGIYRAPWFLPKKNPVKLSLAIRYFSPKKNDWVWGFCHTTINIYDAYKVAVIHESTGRIGLNAKIIDSASFVVSVFPKKLLGKIAHIGNIQNYEPTVLKEGKNAFTREIISVTGTQGTIHITDNIETDSLSSDYPPEVYFEFPMKEVFYHRVQYKVRTVTTEWIDIHGYGLPLEVNFIANRLPQKYTITTFVTQNREDYKLIVTPVEKK